ncbi:MAG: (Fe-S)-binding protein [Anaerotardibacter sp.]
MKIAFFPQCMVDMFYPEVGQAAVRVLERLGCELTLPKDQVCCGQPLLNAGYSEESLPLMKNIVDSYEQFDTIVALTGSCAYAIKHDYPVYLGNDPVYGPKVKELSKRIFEFTEFIVDVLGVTDLGAQFDGKVTLHKSCHMTRMLGVKEPPVKLLEAVDGLEYIEMKAADRCCGFGGVFSVKEPEISEQMVREKCLNVIESGADVVTGCDQACLMNIKGCLDRMATEGTLPRPIKVLHIAQILDSREGR